MFIPKRRQQFPEAAYSSDLNGFTKLSGRIIMRRSKTNVNKLPYSFPL